MKIVKGKKPLHVDVTDTTTIHISCFDYADLSALGIPFPHPSRSGEKPVPCPCCCCCLFERVQYICSPYTTHIYQNYSFWTGWTVVPRVPLPSRSCSRNCSIIGLSRAGATRTLLSRSTTTTIALFLKTEMQYRNMYTSHLLLVHIHQDQQLSRKVTFFSLLCR